MENATAASGKKTAVALNGMELTTMDRLSEIRARCDAATPGPWFNFEDWLIHTETDVEHNGIPHEKTIGSVKVQNASFIAHAREDIPYLLEQINISTARAEKAEAERDTYRAALQSLHINPELLAPKAGDHR